MGLMSKIEDKLSGSSKHEAEKEAQQQERQHHSSSGSHGNTGTSGLSEREQNLRHPVQSSTPGSTGTSSGATSGAPYSQTSGGASDGYGSNDRTGGLGQSGSHGHAQPYSPYSSSGQQTAAAAVDNRSGGSGYGSQAQDYDSSNYGGASDNHKHHHGAGHGSHTQGYDSSKYGGTSEGLKTGPHSELENRSAIPTAGGAKLGSGEGGYSNEPRREERYADQSSGRDHGFGRDHDHGHGKSAGVAGTAGVAGAAGEYEHHKHHHQHQGREHPTTGSGLSGGNQYDQNPYGSSTSRGGDERTTGVNFSSRDRDEYSNSRSNEGVAGSGLTGGLTGSGSGAGISGAQQGGSSAGGNPYDSGYKHALAEKERGYQDAMRKIEAETRGQR